MKITLVTGSYPPDVCGVGDYTARVMSSDTAAGWTLYYRKDWGLRRLGRILREIVATRSDTVILEHPTQGYGWNLTPHLITLALGWFSRRKMVVRLHEYTQLSAKSRAAVKLMLLAADGVIFTNDRDRDAACRRFPRLRRRSAVVKIFTNIGISGILKPVAERSISLVNFGHIRPGKGLEDFLELAARLRREGFTGEKIVLIGQVPDGYESYWERLRPLAERSGVAVELNASGDRVAEVLNDSRIALLPFPDGASERRGSMLAAMANGAAVVSSKGAFTTPELGQALTLADDGHCFDAVKELLLSPARTQERQRAAQDFLAGQMPHSWDDVARGYLRFVERL